MSAHSHDDYILRLSVLQTPHDMFSHRSLTKSSDAFAVQAACNGDDGT